MELLSKHIRHFLKTLNVSRSHDSSLCAQNQEYPLWHFANRYVFQCIKRRMAIRHFVKTENSSAKGFAGYINSVITKLWRFNTWNLAEMSVIMNTPQIFTKLNLSKIMILYGFVTSWKRWRYECFTSYVAFFKWIWCFYFMFNFMFDEFMFDLIFILHKQFK